MDEAPPPELPRRRFRFDSLTFILGFGLGTFIGVAMAIAAFVFVSAQTTTSDQPTNAIDAPPTNTPNPLASATPDRRARTKSQLDVRLGPDDGFAVVGVINRGEAVAIVGRDLSSDWVAIQFPPGSAGRGWLPVKDLDGATDLAEVAVTAATPLARSLPTTAPRSVTSSAGASSDSAPGFDPEPVSTPRVIATTIRADATIAPPTPRPTTAPETSGASDMAISSVTRLADGRVRVVVSNRGPGDVLGSTVFVVVRDLGVRSEQLIGPGQTIAAGGSITLTTAGLVVTEDADIQASVDPMGALRDADRSNNSATVLLRAPATPVPTPAPGRNDLLP